MDKPMIQVVGEDGNIFSITARARVALKRAGQTDKVEEMTAKVQASKSYDEALWAIRQYVDMT